MLEKNIKPSKVMLYYNSKQKTVAEVAKILKEKFGLDSQIIKEEFPKQACAEDICDSLTEKSNNKEELPFGIVEGKIYGKQSMTGFPISGCYWNKAIVINSNSDLPEIVMHEIGHYFGLEHHPNCVMDVPILLIKDYCPTCKSELEKVI